MRNLLLIAAGILFFFSVSSLSFLVTSVTVVSAAEEKKEEAPVKASDNKAEVKPEAKPEIKAEVKPDVKSETNAEPKKEQKKQLGKTSLMGGGDKEPTVITSNSLTADNNAKTALFTGHVVAKKGDRTFYADRMLVHYIESADGESSNIDRIEADGNVKLVRNARVITSDKMIYYAGADERAVFTGGPRATEGKNMLTGTIMTYYMKDDRSVVENSKVFIVEKDQGSQTKRPGTPKSESGVKK
jgi:lipopolysaccharide export system protein LptA